MPMSVKRTRTVGTWEEKSQRRQKEKTRPKPPKVTNPSSIAFPEIFPARKEPMPMPKAVRRNMYPPCTSER